MSHLLGIARCPIIKSCLGGNLDHPCSLVVRSQKAQDLDAFQVPEPWSGRLQLAPILFFSSNPSIGLTTKTQYPRVNWSDKDITEYFEARFGGSHLSSIENGIYDHLPGGERGKTWTRYWAGVKARAAEIMNTTPDVVKPGQDYALSEVVRCKSIRENGASRAAKVCADRYLGETLQISNAKILVVMGVIAENEFRRRFGLNNRSRIHGPISIGGKNRFLIFLPHPNRRGVSKSLTSNLSPEELGALRIWLSN